MRRFRATLIAAACAVSSACGKSTPSPQPPTVSPGDPVTVTGRKNLAWDQGAASLDELAGVGYNLYVDDKPTTFESVPCRTGATAGMFICQLPLPTIAAGQHTLQLTSFYHATPTIESAKSGALQIIVTGIVFNTEAASKSTPTSTTAPQASGGTWPLALMPLAGDLDRPSDLAFTPDGRLWIAERSGHIRVFRDGALLDDPALTLDPRIEGAAVLSVAPDPHFAGNHFIFAMQTERLRSGRLTFAIARYREVADTLADRVVILDNVPASPDPRASLRFGVDGKLYAAFDDGGEAGLMDDPASFNGKILRLNPDGTTPDDAPRKSPIFTVGPASPRGLAWHHASGRLLVADASSVGSIRWAPSPEAIVVLRDELLVGSQAGLVRTDLQRGGGPSASSMSEVFRSVPVRALAAAPDGAIYVATDATIARLQ